MCTSYLNLADAAKSSSYKKFGIFERKNSMYLKTYHVPVSCVRTSLLPKNAGGKGLPCARIHMQRNFAFVPSFGICVYILRAHIDDINTVNIG